MGQERSVLLLDRLIELWLFNDLVRHLTSNLEVDHHFLATWIKGLPKRLRTRDFGALLDPVLLESLEELCDSAFSSLPLQSRARMVEISSQASIWAKPVRDAWENERAKEAQALEREFRDQEISRKVFAESVDLDNTEELWTFGKSLGPYSATTLERSMWGDWVHQYKYENSQLSHEKLLQIEAAFAEALIRFLKLHLQDEYPDRPPFSLCIAVPPNNANGISLPGRICANLAKNHSWLQDGSELLQRTKNIGSIKGKSSIDKRKLTDGLYRVAIAEKMESSSGLLVIDDVYDSGATLRSVCATILASYPTKRLFVVTMAHTLRRRGRS
jgi:predicted amidophosphoribosyltransferase